MLGWEFIKEKRSQNCLFFFVKIVFSFFFSLSRSCFLFFFLAKFVFSFFFFFNPTSFLGRKRVFLKSFFYKLPPLYILLYAYIMNGPNIFPFPLLLVHTEHDRVKCSVCDFSSSLPGSVANHFRRVHAKVKQWASIRAYLELIFW